MTESRHFLGIEIGGTKIQLMVADEQMHVLHKSHFSVGEQKEASRILAGIEREIRNIMQDFHINATGIGFGGPVDTLSGKVYQSFQVEGWTHIPLADWVSGITGTPAFVDNDANIAALAEAVLGAGKGFSSLFYTTLGSGVGGGVILNGEIYHGKAPGEVEFGHLRLNKKGETVESVCSGWALNRKLNRYVSENKDCPLASLVKSSGQDASKVLMAAIKEGDKGAHEILDETLESLSFALSHIVHLFNPDIVVLGGGLSMLGNHITDPVKRFLPAYLMDTMKSEMPGIICAKLGQDVVPLGALWLAINQYKQM